MIAGEIETLVSYTNGYVHYFPKILKKRLREIFIDEGGDKEPKLNGKVEVDSSVFISRLYFIQYEPRWRIS